MRRRLEGGAQVEDGRAWAGWWWGEVGFVTWGLVTGWILGEGDGSGVSAYG